LLNDHLPSPRLTVAPSKVGAPVHVAPFHHELPPGMVCGKAEMSWIVAETICTRDGMPPPAIASENVPEVSAMPPVEI